MIPETLTLAAILLVSLTSIFILINRDWRYCIVSLAVQYVGVFVLVYASWPVEMAIAKMVAGWMAGAILGIAMASLPDSRREYEQSSKLGPVFIVFAAAILALVITSLVLHSDSWLSSISMPIRWGSLILISMGVLQLSVTSHSLRVIIGLLTALSGFEIIYAAVETSTLVTGLQAGVTLSLALVGAYLMIAPTMEGSR